MNQLAVAGPRPAVKARRLRIRPHRAGYVCPSGKAPFGDIESSEGGLVFIEGAVCCPR